MNSFREHRLFLTICLLVPYGTLTVGYKVSVVTTSKEFQQSLTEASPGDLIYLQNTIFKGQFLASQSGTNESRITVIPSQGLPEQVNLVGQGTNKATLNITGSYWTFSNFTIHNKNSLGLLVAGNGNIMEDLLIDNVAKGVRIKGNGNTLQNCVIQEAKFGGVFLEGDNNSILNNTIVGSDLAIFGRKRTSGGILRGNRYDGKRVVDGTDYVF